MTDMDDETKDLIENIDLDEETAERVKNIVEDYGIDESDAVDLVDELD
jgi:antitoxin component of RelBE/YafQ-DinJ toxin-antitoxin module